MKCAAGICYLCWLLERWSHHVCGRVLF